MTSPRYQIHRRFIGIERDQKPFTIAERRIAEAAEAGVQARLAEVFAAPDDTTDESTA